MRTFLVADTHFGHASIIRLTSRPFPGVEAMDAEMAALPYPNPCALPDRQIHNRQIMEQAR